MQILSIIQKYFIFNLNYKKMSDNYSDDDQDFELMRWENDTPSDDEIEVYQSEDDSESENNLDEYEEGMWLY